MTKSLLSHTVDLTRSTVPVKRLCLFAHFDIHDVVAPHVRTYLAALGSCGFSIVIISTSSLPADVRDELPANVIDVILRDNSGLDFGSWACGFRKWGQNCAGDLLLANDSVFAPVGDLDLALERLVSVDADIFGMVASNEIRPHLQSWFLLFRRAAWDRPAFEAFLNQPFDTFDKSEVIAKGELGVTDFAAEQGLRVHAAFPASTIPHRPLVKANPTHYLWREIVELDNLPFVKVDLLRDNPARLTSVTNWRRIVGAKAPDLLIDMEAYLRRVRGSVSADERPNVANLIESFVEIDYACAAGGRRFAQIANYARFQMALLPTLLRDRVLQIPVLGPVAQWLWHRLRGSHRR